MRSACLGLLLAVGTAACSSTPRAVSSDRAARSLPPPADAERYELSGATTTVEAHIYAMGTYTLRFPVLEGELVVSHSAPERSTSTVVVDMRALEASFGVVERIAKREFLEVDRYPTASFETIRADATDEDESTYEVHGVLDLHGVRRNIVVPVRVVIGRCAVVMVSEFEIDRGDFDIEGSGLVEAITSDDVAVVTRSRVRRKDAPASCRQTARIEQR